MACVAMGMMAAGHGAAAQDAAPATGEVRVDYESWQLFCAAPKAGAQQDCEIHQLLKSKQDKLVAGMYLAKRGGGKLLMVRVPLGVLLNKNMMLQIDSGIGTDALSYLRCDTGGCVAQMIATEPFIAALRKGTDVTLTMYADATKPVPIKFVLKGFAAAEKALSER